MRNMHWKGENRMENISGVTEKKLRGGKRFFGLRAFGLAFAACMLMLLSSCGENQEKENAPSLPETTVEETNPENGYPLSKQPDPTAPVLENIIVYASDGKGGVEAQMDAADKLTEDNVLNLLIQYGTIGEGTVFVNMDIDDSEETAAAGPGGEGTAIRHGILTLSDFSAGEGLTEETAKQAVIDTFRENYGLEDVELILE